MSRLARMPLVHAAVQHAKDNQLTYAKPKASLN